MEVKFYSCEQCGNITAMVKNSGVPVVCCSRKMTEIIPGSVSASTEKHCPVYQIQDGIVTVTVGAAVHPMEPVHYIEWIVLNTNLGLQQTWLNPGDAPTAQFALQEGEQVEAVYAYCNLHGLWKAE